jgi:hypothetical protein
MQRHTGRTGQASAGRARLIAWMLGACLTGAWACTDTTKLAGACHQDSDCPTKFKCNAGLCVCSSNESCLTGEICNVAGFCQAKVGCTTSLECPAGEFCDTSSGNCIETAHCTEDVQCDLGQVCDQIRAACVNGCREVGDCPLGAVCQCPDNQTCAAGAILTCVVGPCGDDSYCHYGEQCVPVDPTMMGSPKHCVVDDRGPFCKPCTIGAGQELCAGSTPNFCLVDTSKSFNANYCGVDCSDPTNNSCPWGFECSDVLILTEQTCGGGGAMCPVRPSPTCASDAECVSKGRGGKCDLASSTCKCVKDSECGGGLCDVATGACRSKCVGGEGDVQGFCTCLEHSDCPTDTCNTFNHRCNISLKDCDPNVADSCAPIFCKKVADPQSKEIVGYCFIGSNCAPVAGVTCDRVNGGN